MPLESALSKADFKKLAHPGDQCTKCPWLGEAGRHHCLSDGLWTGAQGVAPINF